MAVRYPRVLIVSAPTATRTVLYDFNDDTQDIVSGSKTELPAAEWSFGELNLLGDPDSVGVEWALQRITFRQTITGSKSATMSRQVAMSKALLRRRFWLEFQLDASTAPVWWHAYRTPPGELSLEQVYLNGALLPDRWDIGGGIDVDAFSYGARITYPVQTVGNNPAQTISTPASSYRLLPEVRGDAPSRLRLKVTPSTSQPLGPQRWLVSVTASTATGGPKPTRVPIGTGDGFNVYNGTSAPATDADAADGSNRTIAFTQGTARLKRLDGALPRNGAAPGQYLVLLRCSAKGTGGTTISAQLSAFAGAPFGPVVNATFTETTSEVDNYQWLPLATIGINDEIPVDLAMNGFRNVELYIGSSNVNATAKIDDFLLIPVSGVNVVSSSVLIVDLQGGGASNISPLFVDGDAETSWLGNTPGGAVTIAARGGYPQVEPSAASNYLFVLPIDSASSVGDQSTSRTTGLNATADVEVSYHPRNAWLGDGA